MWQGKNVILPQVDIEKLERARILLWEIIEPLPPLEKSIYLDVSQPIWLITHKKYPKEGIFSKLWRKACGKVNQ